MEEASESEIKPMRNTLMTQSIQPKSLATLMDND